MKVTLKHVHDIAMGAAFLGTGGGGDPYPARLLLEQELARGAEIEVIRLDSIPDDFAILPAERMGAPTVAIEKVPRGDEASRALRALEAHLGWKADATMSLECGGYNSLLPLLVGARLNLPVVDADGKGRAFPELHMSTYHAGGVQGCPMAICNEHGDIAILQATSNERMERMARAITVWAGGTAQIALYPMDGRTAKRVAIPGTLSLGMAIGDWLRRGDTSVAERLAGIFEAMRGAGYGHGVKLAEGKIADVHRRVEGGFIRGHIAIERFDTGSTVEVGFQNEYLVAREGQALRTISPDLIVVVEADTLRPITTERVRFGQRVAVLGIEAPSQLRTDAALALVGPEAFGLGEDYTPLGSLASNEALMV